MGKEGAGVALAAKAMGKELGQVGAPNLGDECDGKELGPVRGGM